MLAALSRRQPSIQWLHHPPTNPLTLLLWSSGVYGGARAHPLPSTYSVSWTGAVFNSQFSITTLIVGADGAVNGTLGVPLVGFPQGYVVQMPQGWLLGTSGIGRWYDSATGAWETCWTEYAPGYFPFYPDPDQPSFPPGVVILLQDGTYAGPGNPKVWVNGDIIFQGTLTGAAGPEGVFEKEWDPDLETTEPYFSHSLSPL